MRARRYIFLVDRTHEALNTAFANVYEIPMATTVEDTNTLKRYAEEAEINGAHELAARHYQERIARAPRSVDLWCDYAEYCLRVGDAFKAEECLREAIALDERHVSSLAAYAMLCASRGRYPEADTFMRAALASATPAPDALLLALSALLRRLMARSREDEDDVEAIWIQARALYAASAAPGDDSNNTSGGGGGGGNGGNGDEAGLSTSPSMERLAKAAPFSLNILVAQYLLKLRLASLAERMIAAELLEQGSVTVDMQLCRGEGHMQTGEYAQAESCLSAVVRHQPPLDGLRAARALALWGHLRLVLGDDDEAEAAYERTLRLCRDDSRLVPDLLAVYLRLGSLYVSKAKFADAKHIYLRACKLSPSAFTWLGVGVSCYRLGELDQAEEALSEANILNNFDADVWGYLTLVCLKTGRTIEGDQAFMQALKQDLTNAPLFAEIGAAYLGCSRPSDAEQCIRRSISLEELAHSHRLLAEVLRAQGQRESAVAEYMMVLASTTDEADLMPARKALVELLTQLGRVDQADFYRTEITHAIREAERLKREQADAQEAARRAIEHEL